MFREIVPLSIAAIAVAASIALVGCGSSGTSGASAASSASSPAAASSTASKDFDGSKFSDTGAGTMKVLTAGGTSEGGKVPQVASSRGTTMIQIGLDYVGGDGSVCTLYVDGAEVEKVNAGEFQKTLTLEGPMLDQGVHTVELVKMDGDKPAIYKKAQYEIVW